MLFYLRLRASRNFLACAICVLIGSSEQAAWATDSPGLAVAESGLQLNAPQEQDRVSVPAPPVIRLKEQSLAPESGNATSTPRINVGGWVAREQVRIQARLHRADDQHAAAGDAPAARIASTKHAHGLGMQGKASGSADDSSEPEQGKTISLEGLKPVPMIALNPPIVEPQAEEAVDRHLQPANTTPVEPSPVEPSSDAGLILAPATMPERTIAIRRPDVSGDGQKRPAVVVPMQPETDPDGAEDQQDSAEEAIPSQVGRIGSSLRHQIETRKSEIQRGWSEEGRDVGRGERSFVGDLDAGIDEEESETITEGGERVIPPASNPDKSTAPQSRQPLTVTPAVKALLPRLDGALRYYYARPENVMRRSNWGILHSIMVYGVDTQVTVGSRRHNAIAWIAGNNVCRGQRLLAIEKNQIAPRHGPGLQGHQGQLLTIFGLVGVPESYPLYAGARRFSMSDLIRHEQDHCRAGAELTFTLIGLAHYLDTDQQWVSNDGQRWNFERLLKEELEQPVIGAACGGTHRLMGFSHALRIRRQQGKPINGQWARAEKFLSDFVDYTWKLQNPDGSMSTEWFEGRGNKPDSGRKIQTTGHVVEWLIGVLPDERLQDPNMVRAVNYLATTMYNERNTDWEVGPKGHALRALALYRQRVVDSPAPWKATNMARQQGPTNQRRR